MKLPVRVRPGARRAAVGGTRVGPRGPALLVAVRAKAVDGAANAAVVAALATAFALRRRDVELVAGVRGRDKVVALAGDDEELAARLEQLLD